MKHRAVEVAIEVEEGCEMARYEKKSGMGCGRLVFSPISDEH